MDDLQNYNWFRYDLADQLDDVDWFIKETDWLYTSLGLKGYSAKKKMFRVVITNLLATHFADQKRFIAVGRNREPYSKIAKRYNPSECSFRIIECIDALSKKGMIDLIKLGVDGVVSRIRMKQPLLDYYENGGFMLNEYQISLNQNAECIILKDEDKKLVQYEDNEEIVKWRSALYSFNNLLRQHFIACPIYPVDGIVITTNIKISGKWKKIKQTKKVEPHNKFVKRIFNNNSFENGGRYYGGWWQNIGKEWREHITIDGNPTIEVDYSSIHIVLLYQLEGVDYYETHNNDPYLLTENVMNDYYNEIKSEQKDDFRQFCKQVIITSLNSKDVDGTCKSIIQTITNERDEEGNKAYEWIRDLYGTKEGNKKVLKHPWLKQLVGLIQHQHPTIKKYFNSQKASWLQFIDSKLTEKVINEFCILGIPVLAIHDSFIVETTYLKELQLIMKNVINVKAKTKVIGYEKTIESIFENLPIVKDIKQYKVRSKEVKQKLNKSNKVVSKQEQTSIKCYLDQLNKFNSNSYQSHLFNTKNYYTNK